MKDEKMNKELLKEFKNPRKYRGKPFLSWNGELKDELVRQVKVRRRWTRILHAFKSGTHHRYLGEEWFDLLMVADAGEEEGLESWLYDEDRWPSGVQVERLQKILNTA